MSCWPRVLRRRAAFQRLVFGEFSPDDFDFEEVNAAVKLVVSETTPLNRQLVAPTEMLSSASGQVELPDAGAQIGVAIRTLSHRPRCVLASIYISVALAALLLMSVGTLEISVDESALVDGNDPDVRRGRLVQELRDHGRMWGRTLPESGRRTLSESGCPTVQGEDTVTLIYSTPGSGNVLEPALMQHIHQFEGRLMAWLRSKAVCASANCNCVPFDSALNYIFPAVERSHPVNATVVNALRFDRYSPVYEGMPCGMALRSADLAGVLDWLRGHGQVGFFGAYEGLGNEQWSGNGTGATHSARYLRTRISLPVSMRILGADALDFIDLIEAGRTAHLKIHSDVAEVYWSLGGKRLTRWLAHDGLLLGMAILLVLGYMICYFGNVLFALAAVMQVFISLPIVFCLMSTVLVQTSLSAVACTSIYVVLGVSADNIFVVHETWRAAKLLRINGVLAPRERRLRWTLAQAAWPLLVADGTTAFSLFINCISPIKAVFQFGLCGGLLILTNFVLVFAYMPALLSLEEAGWFGRTQCCAVSERTARSRLWRLHVIHRHLFQWRRPIVCAFLLSTALLLQPAIRLLSERNGTTFDLFAELAIPAGVAFARGSTFDYSSTKQTIRLGDSTGGDPPLPAFFERLLRHGEVRPAARLSLKMWPAVPAMCAGVLVVDVLLLAAVARVWWTGRPLGFLRMPGALQRHSIRVQRRCAIGILLVETPVLALAVYAGVLASTEPAALATSLGCDFASHGTRTLSGLLACHAFIFGGLAVIYYSDRLSLWLRGFLRRARSAKVARIATGLFYTMLSIACLVLAVLLLYDPGIGGGSGGGGGGGGDEDSEGGVEDGSNLYYRSSWLSDGAACMQTSWQRGSLVLLWLIWSLLLLAIALCCFCGWRVGHVVPPERRMHSNNVGWRYFGGVVCWQAMAWAMLAFCGSPSMPSDTTLAVVLGVCLLLNMVVHCIVAWLIAAERTLLGCLAPTPWTQRYPRLAANVHLLLAAGWLVLAQVSHRASNYGSAGLVSCSLGLTSLAFAHSVTLVLVRPLTCHVWPAVTICVPAACLLDDTPPPSHQHPCLLPGTPMDW